MPPELLRVIWAVNPNRNNGPGDVVEDFVLAALALWVDWSAVQRWRWRHARATNSRSPGGRRVPPLVLAFLVITTGSFAYGLTRVHHAFWHRWPAAVFIILLFVLLVGPLVFWCRRWAWLVWLLFSLELALLLSPQMRRYVGLERRAAASAPS